MRNRRRTWFLRRLVLGFAVALVAVPAAQAYPDEGSSSIAPQRGGLPTRGDDKADIGATTSRVVIVGDDKQGLPSAPSVVLVGHPDNRADRSWPGVVPTVDPAAMAEYRENWRVTPSDISAQAALEATTREYVAGSAPVVDEPVQVVSNTSDGFDWGDAGIGAGTIFAVMLLGVGAVLVTRHVSHPASV
jgi:hypothetical protein